MGLAHAFGVAVEGNSLAEVWAGDPPEQVQVLQHEELVVWDSPHRLDGMSFSGGNPSDLAADCPLLETGYPIHVWDPAGMLGSAYKKIKLPVYSLTATATWYLIYSTRYEDHVRVLVPNYCTSPVCATA